MQIDPDNISLCGQIKRLTVFKEAKRLGDSRLLGALYLALDEAELSQNPENLGENFASRLCVYGHEPVYMIYMSDEQLENEFHLSLLDVDDFVRIKCKIEKINVARYGTAVENVVIGRFLVNGELDQYVEREGPRAELI